MKIDLEDSSSTQPEVSDYQIEFDSNEYLKKAVEEMAKSYIKSLRNLRRELRALSHEKVKVDDPRPPIKQRLRVKGDIGKCHHCWSEKVYNEREEDWVCPFCEL